MTDPKPLWRLMRDAYLQIELISHEGHLGFAAEIRAIANCLYPEELKPSPPSADLLAARIDFGCWVEQQQMRKRLLAEADRAEAGE